MIVISDVTIKAASPSHVKTGLIGFLSFTVSGALRVDGVTLRRTSDDRLTLSFPCRRDGNKRQHFILSPLDDVSRREIEHQVFAALGIRKDHAQ